MMNNNTSNNSENVLIILLLLNSVVLAYCTSIELLVSIDLIYSISFGSLINFETLLMEDCIILPDSGNWAAKHLNLILTYAGHLRRTCCKSSSSSQDILQVVSSITYGTKMRIQTSTRKQAHFYSYFLSIQLQIMDLDCLSTGVALQCLKSCYHTAVSTGPINQFLFAFRFVCQFPLMLQRPGILVIKKNKINIHCQKHKYENCRQRPNDRFL